VAGAARHGPNAIFSPNREWSAGKLDIKAGASMDVPITLPSKTDRFHCCVHKISRGSPNENKVQID